MPQLTFLQLAQRLALDCGETKTGLTTVVGQTGRLLRVCNAIANAWVDIQQKHVDWRFLRQSASWATVDGQALYTPAQCGIAAETLGTWIRDSFRVYNTAAGFGSEQHLTFCPYERWRDLYQFGAFRTTKSRPTDVTIAPDDSIGLGLVPLAGYTVVGDYYRTPVRLTGDADVPALPIKHDALIIVYRAMMLYGPYLGAPELYDLGKTEYLPRFDALEADQLPELSFA